MRHLVPIATAVFVVAGLAIFTFGDSGVISYGNLSRYESELAANVERLQRHNGELTAELDRLKKDPEENAVLAHGIGLYRADEEVVRVEGSSARATPWIVGDMLRMRRDTRLRNPLLKGAALGVALLLLAWSALSARRKAHGAQGR